MSGIIKTCEYKMIEIPLREVFRISTAEKQTIKNIALRLELDTGITGYGEISPLFLTDPSDYDRIIRRLGEAVTRLVGQDIDDYQQIIRRVRSDGSDLHFALSGLEIAIYDALTRSRSLPLYQFFGGQQTRLETDMTIGITSPTDTVRLTRSHLGQGFRKIKMKVGLDVSGDIERILAVANVAKEFLTLAEGGPSPEPLAIYLDANQGYSLAEALTVIDAVERNGLPVTLFEQPLPKDDLKGLQDLTRRSRIPIAADESVASLDDALRVLEAQAAHVINIKLAKTGILTSLDIMAAAQSAGLRLMIGGMLESKIGISASVHLACGTGAFTYHDLDTIYLLSDYAVGGGFENQGPVYSVQESQAGTGVNDHQPWGHMPWQSLVS